MSGVSPSFQMQYGCAEVLKQGNYNDSIILKAIYLRKINDEFYRGQLDKRIAQNIIDSFREEKWFPLLFLPHRGYLPDTVTKSNWYKTMDFDPAVYLNRVSIPALFFYGSYDQWVPIDSSISMIKNNMLQAHNNQYKIYRLKKGGHLMTTDIFNMSDTNFSEEFDQELKKWYAQRASD
jgi:pimeloyl-ACP methyl ester carboxylesterase